MKTPQEQAEEMARKVGLARYGTNPTYSFDAVMKIIPLPELIAIAQAANGLSFGSDWNNGTHAKEHGYRQKLINALQALRATGKVEL